MIVSQIIIVNSFIGFVFLLYIFLHCSMRYYSLHQQSPTVDFRTASIQGQAPDKGLYFPAKIPQLDTKWIAELAKHDNETIAYEVIRPYVGDTIAAPDLQQIVQATIDFPIPLVRVTDRISSLELYHGPTLAFKDIGARFMSRCLAHFVKGNDKKITVLVATSGDTGGAVANGFYDVEGVEVIILYPSGKVSNVQEQQLTTLGKNITALEVQGNFDDCQQMVKAAFLDEDLRQKLALTSANSINVARWLPQQFYYFFAYKQWQHQNTAPIVCVPSGNFGNICAGLLAHASGLPVAHFLAACNANDTVPEFLQTGQYLPKKAKATISNAMDVSDPSNFVRIMEIFEQNQPALKKCMSSSSIDDATTKASLQMVWQKHQYLCDPHGAVGFHALEQYLQNHPSAKGFFLETAHPIKFYDVVEPIIGERIPIPASIQKQLNKKKQSILLKNGELKEYLMNK
jgi:threonine synthase